MQRSKWLSGLATAALLAAVPLETFVPARIATVQAQEVRASFNIFYNDLEPHGVWVRHARYKYVWSPEVDVR